MLEAEALDCGLDCTALSLETLERDEFLIPCVVPDALVLGVEFDHTADLRGCELTRSVEVFTVPPRRPGLFDVCLDWMVRLASEFSCLLVADPNDL